MSAVDYIVTTNRTTTAGEAIGATDNTSASTGVISVRRRVCVVGAGYVGLTAAACLAHLGHYVRCVEAAPDRLAQLQAGDIPIHEPGLDELVATGRADGRLEFFATVDPALNEAEVAMLCVGTPPQASGEPDLSHLALAAAQVAQAACSDLIVVVKSTVPPGTCEAMELICADHAAPGIRIRVASSPEFLRESRAIGDFLAPDRVVVGTDDADVAQVVASLYPAGSTVVRCDRRGAELVKYAANTFLAIKISFANEVARLCEAFGTDAGTVLTGVGLDSRIGTAFLQPGPGYGGSCLPKDVAGFQALGLAVGVDTLLASAAEKENAIARNGVVAKLGLILGNLAGRRVAVLGLAFKEGTDDSRDSPGVHVADQLVAAGADVRCYDPLARCDHLSPTRVPSAADAVRSADVVVITTASHEISAMDPAVLVRSMAGNVVLDAVSACDLSSWSAAGLAVYGIGRGTPLDFHPIVWAPLLWAHPSPVPLNA